VPPQKRSMRRVAEGIYRRPSGKYVAPIYDQALGKKVYSLPGVPRGGFDTIEEAKAFKRRFEQQKSQAGSSKETCDEFAKRWTKHFPRPDETTNTHNAERVRAFTRDFKGVPLSEVTKGKARGWALEHPNHLKAVRAMFSDAVKDGLVHQNPFASLGLPEGPGRRDILLLTDEEIGKLVTTAAQVWDGWGESTFGPMLVLAAHTGARPGELFGLRWSDVDFERDDLHIRRQLQSKTMKEKLPKGRGGGKPRTVVLLPPAQAALKRIPRSTSDPYVFHIPSGGRFSQRVHHYYWSPVRAAFWATLSPTRQEEIDPGFDFYELRHYFGTLLAEQGATPYEIADQMGHVDGGSLAMRLYIHTRSEEARDRIKARFRDQQMLGLSQGESQAG
jgi:integrase